VPNAPLGDDGRVVRIHGDRKLASAVKALRFEARKVHDDAHSRSFPDCHVIEDGVYVPVWVTQITSRTGATTCSEFVVVPLTTHELRSMEHHVALNLVRDAVLLARQRGASVVGLGGHLSVVTGAGLELGDLGTQVTTGSSYTSATAVEATREILASGSVGRGVALLLLGGGTAGRVGVQAPEDPVTLTSRRL